MSVSQKCQYALRAVFELSKRFGNGPTTIAEIAGVQAIPARFLESILGQLRQGGFVESRRGIHGGYMIARPPKDISIGDLIGFVDGPVGPVRCVAGGKGSECPLFAHCSFMGLWERARDAVKGVYDTTSFQDLIDEEAAMAGTPDFCI